MRLLLTLIFIVYPFLFCPAQDLDRQLLNSWHRDRDKSLDGVMNALDFTVYPISLALPLAQCLRAYAAHDEKSLEYGLQTATAVVLNTVITYGLKYSIDRNRPYEDHPEYQPHEYDSSPSFPSGHVSFAFTTATSLSLEYRKWYVVLPAYLWAGSIGYSRIHLGAHYPSDVLAGALVGAASGYISYKGNQMLKRWWAKKTKERFAN